MILLADRVAGSIPAALWTADLVFIDAAGLDLDPAEVRGFLDLPVDEDCVCVITLPPGTPPEELAARIRPFGEEVRYLPGPIAPDSIGAAWRAARPITDAVSAPPSLQTARLLLTYPRPDQVDGYYADIAGTTIFDTLLWGGPAGPEDLHIYWHVQRQCALDGQGQPLSVAVIERSSDRCVGGAALRPIDGDREHIDLGYAFAPHAHGKGYATEAVGALVDLAFEERGAQRIFATVFVGNQASRRVAEKLGFTCDGVLRNAVRKNGVLRDEWVMTLTRQDWSQKQERRRG